MDVIDLRTQSGIFLPSQCFIPDYYGTPLVQDTIAINVSLLDLCTNTFIGADAVATRIGHPTLTRGCEYYVIRFDALGASPLGYPGNVGPMRPGHRYAMLVVSSAPDPEFMPFNVGPFGVTDHRIDVLDTASPKWETSDIGMRAVWTHNAWTWARNYLGDGRAGSAVFVSADDHTPVIDTTSWEYQDADPEAIHYNPKHDSMIAFDGYRLHCHGAPGIQDGTPWHEASVNPLYSLFDLPVNMSQIPVNGSSQYQQALSTSVDMPTWWMAAMPFASGAEGYKASYRYGREVSTRLFLTESPPDSVSCDSMRITTDLQGFRLLPFRYIMSNGNLFQEFGSMSAPEAWWRYMTGPDYTIARRQVLSNSDSSPFLLNAVDFWHASTFHYGDLVIL